MIKLKCAECKSLNPLKYDQNGVLNCESCRKKFYLINDFTSFIAHNEDYTRLSEDDAFLRFEASSSATRVTRYFLPYLKKIGYGTGSRILVLGCGTGSDVEVFVQNSYSETYGIDLAWRTAWWKKMGYSPERYFAADGCNMPFMDEEFDVIICLGVMEHIGAIGESTKLYLDYDSQRAGFVKSVLRTLKPDGVAIFSCPNRLFPIDFQHDASRNFIARYIADKTGIYFHSPFNRFLWSYGDLRRKIAQCAEGASINLVSVMPIYNYLGLGFIYAPVMRPLKPIFQLILQLTDYLPGFIRGSFINPYMLAAVFKKNTP